MFKGKIAVLASTLLLSGVAASADLNTGLVAHWSFDDCTAIDSSTNHFDGTMQGKPECTTGVTLDGTTGKALQFNGSTDWIEGNIDSTVFAGNWSIAAWFYHTGYGAPWEAIFSNSTNGVNNTPLMTFNGDVNQDVVDETSNYLGINRVGSTAAGTFVDLGSHFSQWIFAVITYENGVPTIYTYKNGKLIKASQALSWDLQQSSGFYIGRHFYGKSNQLFKGKIDEVKIYNRALSTTEVSNLYNQSINITGSMKGFMPKGFSVECQNITTGQNITLTSNTFNCEAAGLVVSPKDTIHINVDGKAK